jgi:hypothetical protein
MRARGGRIVLLDFGLAHEIDPTARRGAAPGGTPLFMAPELLLGAKQFDARVDLYSLGVTLYWLVTTKWPYDVASREELIEKMEREPSIPLLDRRADLPAAYVAVVERAVAKDPAQRFASAGEMEAALRAVGAARAAALTRRKLASVAVAALLLVATVMAFTAWRGRAIRAEVVMARLEKAAGSGQPDFVPLADGTAVTIGDQLVAELTLDHAAYVYVFNADKNNHFFALFPISASTLKNPVSAGRTRLPGPLVNGGGRPCVWTINSPGEEESYVVFVAREPVAKLQAMWEMCRKPTRDGDSGGTDDGQELRGTFRGTGKVGGSSEVLAETSNKKFIDELKEMADHHIVVDGVTVLQQSVKNTGG